MCRHEKDHVGDQGEGMRGREEGRESSIGSDGERWSLADEKQIKLAPPVIDIRGSCNTRRLDERKVGKPSHLRMHIHQMDGCVTSLSR